MRLSSVSFSMPFVGQPRVATAGQDHGPSPAESHPGKKDQYERAARVVLELMERRTPKTLPLFMTRVNQLTTQPGGPQPLTYAELATQVLERVRALPHTMVQRATTHIEGLLREHDRCVKGKVSPGGRAWATGGKKRREPMAFRRQSA